MVPAFSQALSKATELAKDSPATTLTCAVMCSSSQVGDVGTAVLKWADMDQPDFVVCDQLVGAGAQGKRFGCSHFHLVVGVGSLTSTGGARARASFHFGPGGQRPSVVYFPKVW